MKDVPEDVLEALGGFEWDLGNSVKNWRRHEVRQAEAEQVMLNRPLVAMDVKHSRQEPRLIALGKTDPGRLLAIVFTMRRGRVRVISARPMSRAERKTYAEARAKTQADS
ncbi:MAG: BrnT family toxin [Chloroflexi bacterium]|nr:BrnT family toxin [Chloroflexota bacterium]